MRNIPDVKFNRGLFISTNPRVEKKESGCVNHDRKVCTHLIIRGPFHDEDINFWIIERVGYKSCCCVMNRCLQNWMYSGEVCSHMWNVCLRTFESAFDKILTGQDECAIRIKKRSIMFTTWVLRYDPNRTSTTDCSLIGTILSTCMPIDRKRSNICESLLTLYFISLMRCEKGFSTVLGCLGTSWSIKHVLSEQPGGRFITLL